MIHLTDQQLWEEIVKDDHAAFNQLFERYWSKVYSTAFNYLRDQQVCKEITHEVFLNIWLHRNSLNIKSFAAYLQTCARYHVYKYSKKKSPVSFEINPDELPAYACRNEGDENLSRQELENSVNEYLQSLPKRCRHIFILSRKEHMSNEQIAGKLGISKRTVENQITHALHHLRVVMKTIVLFFF